MALDFSCNSYSRKEAEGKPPKITLGLETHNVDDTVKTNPTIEAFVQKYQTLSDKKFQRKIFKTSVSFDPSVATVRFKEGALTNWVCDICLEDYSIQQRMPKVDLCMLIGGTFKGKAPMNPGDISLGDIWGFFPERVLILIVELTGDDIVKTPASGGKNLPNEECYDLNHVSANVKYTIDLAPKKENPKNPVIAKDVMLNGKPIDVNTKYNVVITDQMGIGNYGFTWYKTARRIVSEEHANQLQDLILMYCKRHINDSQCPANPKMGRIEIVNQ